MVTPIRQSAMAGAERRLSPLLGIFLLVGLYLTSLYNYLLFHSLAEIFGIVIACGIFMLAWNSRRLLDNSYLLFIGIAYLFVAVLDIMHTLSYKGMGVFPGYGTNLPTQLWIAARYVEALSLLVWFLFLGRSPRGGIVFLGYALVSSLLLGAIFYWDVFPVCFVEGTGLTPFKKTSEYAISLILLVAIVGVLARRRDFDKNVLRLLVASLLVTIASELAFTFYVHAYGFSNLLGHYLKIVSFYLIYVAIIQTGLTKPYSLLFRNLKQNEEALQRARNELEDRVKVRTAELKESEAKYRGLVDNSMVGIFHTTRDGQFVLVNDALARMYDYDSREQMISRGVLPHWHDPKERERLLAALQEHGSVNSFEAETITCTGRHIHVLFSANLYGDNILGMVMNITERKRAEEQLQAHSEKLKALAAQLTIAEERERRRIAGDLHDNVGQSLAFARMRLSAARKRVPEGKLAAVLDEISESLLKAVQDTRNLLYDLSPPLLIEAGLAPAVAEWLEEEIETRHGLKTEFTDDGQEKYLGEDVRAMVFRSVRELLSNVVKHAETSKVSVSLKRKGTCIEVVVQDDGVGFGPDAAQPESHGEGGFGLFSIKERMADLGGSLEIVSQPGKGCRAVLIVPLGTEKPGEG